MDYPAHNVIILPSSIPHILCVFKIYWLKKACRFFNLHPQVSFPSSTYRKQHTAICSVHCHKSNTDLECRNLSSTAHRTEIALLPPVTAGSTTNSELAGIGRGSDVNFEGTSHVVN